MQFVTSRSEALDKLNKYIENDISNWNFSTQINISHIGLIVALDYLDFRKIINWKNKKLYSR